MQLDGCWTELVDRACSQGSEHGLLRRLVSYLVYKRPTTSWGLLACMRRWSRRHREKHAERLQISDHMAPGDGLEKNPFLWCDAVPVLDSRFRQPVATPSDPLFTMARFQAQVTITGDAYAVAAAACECMHP